MEYIGEERVLSKGLSEYGGRKGTSLTCANRLAEFLGSEILRDGGGLNVRFLISKKPHDAKVAERAIPTAIFEAEKSVKEKYLKKWLKDPSLTDFGIRSLLDWDYYKERLGGSIQKIVTIPAALQKCMNPIPRIAYPDWLHKRIKVNDDKFKQKELKHFFKVAPQKQIMDVEDL
jgi:DNA polymerase epsilon subunit 1